MWSAATASRRLRFNVGRGFSPYALTYASSHESRAGVLIDTLAFGKQEVPGSGSALPFDSGQAESRLDRGNDSVKQKPCQAPVADWA